MENKRALERLLTKSRLHTHYMYAVRRFYRSSAPFFPALVAIVKSLLLPSDWKVSGNQFRFHHPTQTGCFFHSRILCAPVEMRALKAFQKQKLVFFKTFKSCFFIYRVLAFSIFKNQCAK
jgi:hypothetical protein